MTARIKLDDLTSDQYDELCDRLERAEAELNTWAENESADAAAGSYAGRAEQAEADLEQARADAEQHARNTLTVARERDSYRKAWKEEQQRRARAEAALIRPGLVPDDNPVTDTDPAWTPPPPGDKREQLPDALLALIDVPPYTSTACEAAILLARQMPKHTQQRVELGDHSDRLHGRCRRNNKFTGALCGCPCHTDAKEF